MEPLWGNLTINNPQTVKVVRRFNSNTNLPGKVVHLLETVCYVCLDLSEIEQMQWSKALTESSQALLNKIKIISQLTNFPANVVNLTYKF